MCPEIEEQLIKWIEVVRVWKIPLTRHAIQVCALQLFSERNESNEKSFKASRGWFNGFKSRYCLHMYRLVGEAASSKVNDYSVELGKISSKIAEYNINNVYNMDEAAFFYKMLPRFTYCLPTELAVRGTKHEKARVTSIFCCNMTGSEKLPPTIIGKSLRPICFRNSPPPLPYMAAGNGWINKVLFQRWFFEVFVPYVKFRTDDPVLLILDNCSSHMKLEYDNITIIFLPPNVTSTTQPLDQGVISVVKRKYRTKLLNQIVSSISLFNEMSKNPKKSSGLSKGGMPNILDASILLKQAWEEVLPSTIAKCWVKSKIAFDLTNTMIMDTLSHNDNVNSKTTNEVDELCDIVNRIEMKSICETNISQSQKENQIVEDINQWFEIESNNTDVFQEIESILNCDQNQSETLDEFPNSESENENNSISLPIVEEETKLSTMSLFNSLKYASEQFVLNIKQYESNFIGNPSPIQNLFQAHKIFEDLCSQQMQLSSSLKK